MIKSRRMNMGRVCSTHEEERNAYIILVRKNQKERGH
jgi:hypothetical protein